MASNAAEPKPALGVTDVAALIVGVVIGAGIFRLPSPVAASTGSEGAFLLVWLLGGIVSLVGALCYAELATTYPHTGGDYHYLTRAYGTGLAFLFAWARMMVIQTGSIALQAFIIGDYVSELLPLGAQSSSIYAALVVVALTGLSIAGLRPGKGAQNLLSAATVLGLLLVVVAGFVATPAPRAAPGDGTGLNLATLGGAMVFVLLTYGGWNEAAYISAELRDVRRNMLRALLWGLGIITAVYLLANLAYVRGLGIGGVADSDAVAADLMRRAFGEVGANLISLIIAVAALSTINATIITGARTSYAMGRDFGLFAFLGRWQGQANTPANALLVQGAVTLVLLLFGSLSRGRVQTMVDYTAPVFWFFFLLVGISLFLLRRKEPDAERPYRVPFYPVTPLLFCAVSAYMLYSSLAYTGRGALVGVAVLVAGVPLLLLARARQPVQQQTG